MRMILYPQLTAYAIQCRDGSFVDDGGKAIQLYHRRADAVADRARNGWDDTTVVLVELSVVAPE